MMRSVVTILAAIQRIPAVNLEIDEGRAYAGVQVGGRRVARVDLRDGRVVVYAPADTIPTLQRVFPSSHPTADGIVFDPLDAENCRQALAAIDRRVQVERLVPQFRVASP
jgi:hypothetical protein